MRFLLISLVFLVFTGQVDAGCFPAEVVRYSVVSRVENNRLVEEFDVVVQINNRSGESCSEVSIPFNSYTKLQIAEVKITDTTGGIIRKLSRDEIQTVSYIPYGTFYTDLKIKKFVARTGRFPYRINYKYRTESKEFLAISHWSPLDIDGADFVREARLQTILPVDYKVLIKQKNIEAESVKVTDGKRITEWVVRNATREKPECRNETDENADKVIIAPVRFHYETDGSFETWPDFARFVRQINKKAFDLPEGEKEQIKLLCKGLTDPYQVINKVFQFHQSHTRYVNISLGTGGIKPWPASWVSQNKYGDCKALAIYLLSLLREVGIEGDYALLHSGLPIKEIDTSFCFQQFNHVIARIPVGDSVIWLDGTSNLPANHLPVSDRGRYAFVIGRDKAGFELIPGTNAALPSRSNKIHFSFDNQGSLIADAKSRLSGHEFELLKAIDLVPDLSRKERLVENIYCPEGFRMKEWGWAFDSLSAEPAAEIKSASIMETSFTSTGKSSLIITLPSSVPRELKSFWDCTDLFRLDIPLYYTDSLVFDIPPGYYAEQVPGGLSLPDENFSFTTQSFTRDGKVFIVRELKVSPFRITTGNQEHFKTLFEKFSGVQHNSIIILARKDQNGQN